MPRKKDPSSLPSRRSVRGRSRRSSDNEGATPEALVQQLVGLGDNQQGSNKVSQPPIDLRSYRPNVGYGFHRMVENDLCTTNKAVSAVPSSIDSSEASSAFKQSGDLGWFPSISMAEDLHGNKMTKGNEKSSGSQSNSGSDEMHSAGKTGSAEKTGSAGKMGSAGFSGSYSSVIPAMHPNLMDSLNDMDSISSDNSVRNGSAGTGKPGFPPLTGPSFRVVVTGFDLPVAAIRGPVSFSDGLEAGLGLEVLSLGRKDTHLDSVEVGIRDDPPQSIPDGGVLNGEPTHEEPIITSGAAASA
ncbi:hypothetical protein L1987_83189 [Smallanthus sonchifolius]|uniref:Uncharacterized protein n=1 Tax=Smallanthus sonchifolius TaxID=185202 RepID=A0ACB8YBT1_9ASTR|nr:hypothetical protein L1987_83189 [Smallanthus sonchifolius]